MIALIRRFRLVIWSLTGLYAVALFVLTHLPPSELPKTRVSDKVAHFTAYLLLGAMAHLSQWPTRRSLITLSSTALLAALAYGAMDELTQPLVGRFCALDDWHADALGAAAGILVMSLAAIAGGRRIATVR